MGFVFRVRHAHNGTRYALKYLPLPSAMQRDRLLREISTHQRLRHRNIVRLIESIDVGGDPGMVLELVEGPRLDERLAEGRLPLDEALALFEQVTRAVQHAHSRGVVHRDLKPSNVLLTREGVAKLADFGIAKVVRPDDDEDTLTPVDATLGSPAYMSPEQARSSRDVDPRTDLFALGCILYELVCGSTAFGGSGVTAALKAAAEGGFTPSRERAPDAPDWVHDAIARCLEPRREARIGSCKELLELMGSPEDEITVADGEDSDVIEGPDSTVLYGDRAGSHAATVLYGQSAGSAIPPEPTTLMGSKFMLLVLALVALALIVAIAVVSGQSGDSGGAEYVPLEDVLAPK